MTNVPFRILFLVSSMSAGGAERVAANLVNAWASAGVHVTLLVTYSGRGDCFYPLSSAVNLRYLADETKGPKSSGLAYIARFWALRRLVHQERPDVVVSFLTNVNVAAVLATLGARVPVIVCERSYPPQLPVGEIWSLLRRWTYPLASRVAMLTTEGLVWLQREIPRSRGVVMHNPVPYPLPVHTPALLPSDVVAGDRKVLLGVGRLSEEKGFSGLFDAFASLAEQHPLWDLVILGDGPLRSALAQQIQTTGLGSRVFMPGRAGNVGAWYERADLYVLSSRVEGFPNTLGEAMAHGCAAVSFDCDTGPRDLIRHDVDGLLVPPGDVAALAQSLGRLMNDDALRAQMAARALEVRERYSMQRVLSLWDELFTAVLQQKRPS
jgi:glycosyltransferase involved in cell wall biosynthesis